MGKWLAIAAVGLIVLLLIMWRSIDHSAATPTPSPASEPEQLAASPTSAVTATVMAAKPAAEPSTEEAAPEKPAKLDPMGDEFFHKFIDFVPHRLSRDAAECYQKPGLLHRNAKLVLVFNVRIRDGQVTIHDIKVKPNDPDEPKSNNNTLNDPALESCFIQKVARVTWKNDALPDYDWPDELVIRPERGLKKHWKSNIDYVGEEAPKKDFSVHPGTK
jgi:hypothetical protein